MKIVIYGAGAVGGLIAARLAQAGERVAVVARGDTLAALRANGLTLSERPPGDPQASEVTRSWTVEASPDPTALGPADLLVLAVKYTAMPALAESVAPLLGPRTTVLSAMNGIPWWFGHRLPSGFSPDLSAVDPAGAVSRAIDPSCVLGCVVHLAASRPAPGHIRRNMGNRLIVGEPGGGGSDRLDAVVGRLRAAGFEVEPTERLHAEVWYKLWGNMTMNPISAVTGATMDMILADPLLREQACAVMREAQEVGARIGLPIAETPEQRNLLAEALGAFKTSMLQDAEAGRVLELDALLTVVHDIARQVDLPTPHLDGLLGMARVYARAHGL